MKSLIEIFLRGEWVEAAEIESLGVDQCRFSYLPDYVFSDAPEPVAFNLPVGLNAYQGRCPSFLYDLVPQGAGRKFLLANLKLADADELVMPLIQHGAFNPIGRLRINTARQFFEQNLVQARQHDGFTLDEIVKRDPGFVEYLDLHGMLGCGTTGIQGAAPKFLLTQNHDGLWFADTLLADADAAAHWLVKRPRGRDESDIAILRNEAAYMQIAARCGLRVLGGCRFDNDMLFVRRFDRKVVDGKVLRLHQESLASVAGHQQFGIRANHFELVKAMLAQVDDAQTELVEYLKRDVLNLALRNTDNHARNTALQILPDGRVQLTPLFDFAPMFMDREMIARTCKWLDEEGKEIRALDEIIDKLPLEDQVKEKLSNELRAFLPVVESLPTMMRGVVDEGIIEQCRKSIEGQCGVIAAL
ncbi:MAG: type II toxin-antitoxin system HipA family toxin [Sideroxydans sp.]|nr:type II toxin-antitoxin system HipA family toxin [Sideroxydans sp.]